MKNRQENKDHCSASLKGQNIVAMETLSKRSNREHSFPTSHDGRTIELRKVFDAIDLLIGLEAPLASIDPSVSETVKKCAVKLIDIVQRQFRTIEREKTENV